MKDVLEEFFSRQTVEISGNIPGEESHGNITNGFTCVVFEDGHVHYHMVGDKELVEGTLVKYLSSNPESTIRIPYREGVEEGLGSRKIVFKHSRALGDGLMFTAGVRDFKLLFPHFRINVESNQQMLWENNPYIDRSINKSDPGVEFYRVGYPLGGINVTHRHFAGMFFMDMVAQVDEYSPIYTEDGHRFPLWQFCAAYANGRVGDPALCDPEKNKDSREPFISIRNKYKRLSEKGFCNQRGDIHLSESEKKDNLVERIYGVSKYWVVAPGGKRDCTAKIWDWRRFQQVIDHFDGRIKFVVIGRSDHLIEKLDNVIDLTDRFNSNVRGLVPLVYHAEGVVTGPSFLNHLAAAVPPKFGRSRKPCVVVWGGREPEHWCHYTNHQFLHTNGAFSCCDDGGCWKARVVPLPKDPKHNKNLCSNTVVSEGRTIQACMHTITSDDVIRAIDKYYEGDLYTYSKLEQSDCRSVEVVEEYCGSSSGKEINLLGNLNTSGGGEQSLCKIAEVLGKSGWKVNLYPWGTVHKDYVNNRFLVNSPFRSPGSGSFKYGTMKDTMKPGLPLLFYGNDCVWDFPKFAEDIVKKSSAVIIGINFMNGDIGRCEWLAKSGKLKGIVFQNSEKLEEFRRGSFGFEDVSLVHYVGAIDLESMLEVCTSPRRDGDPLVILKHGKPDKRKYVTEETKNRGKKIHIWQKHFGKEPDTKFYSRLLKDTRNTIFEFMVAPQELVNFFKGESRMVFHEWNSMSVEEFLSRGHLYLDRASNDWRHNYPRTVGEALAAGLPVLCEPRDGQKDRVIYGDTGMYCVDYDEYKEAIKKFQRKEKWRHAVGMNAKDWARENLRPEKWVKIVEDLLI